jgi:hypothetical protein
MGTSKKVKRAATHSGLFPAPPPCFYGGCQAKFSAKLKNRPETLVSDPGEDVHLHAAVTRNAFGSHTARFLLATNENLSPVTSLGRWHSDIFAGLFDDALYGLMLERIVLLAHCSSITNV